MNCFDLSGKTAIVTGGGRGLGLGMSRSSCLTQSLGHSEAPASHRAWDWECPRLCVRQELRL